MQKMILKNTFHTKKSHLFHPGKSQTERGQSMVELAVSMVVLLILLAGVVDLGRMIFVYIAMRDAAEEGAVYGSINATHCTQIEQRAKSVLANPNEVTVTININGKSCSTASQTADACYGKTIEVIVEQSNFPITMPLLGTFIGGQSIDLKAQVTNTILRPGCQ